jgi:hypothetical protein
LKDSVGAGDYKVVIKNKLIVMKKLLTIVFLLVFGYLSAFAEGKSPMMPAATSHPSLTRPVRSTVRAHRRRHRRVRRHRRRHIRRLRHRRVTNQTNQNKAPQS